MDNIDRLALWLVAVGVWPFADPGHDLNTMMSWVDLLVHLVGVAVLAARWKVVRRTHARHPSADRSHKES